MRHLTTRRPNTSIQIRYKPPHSTVFIQPYSLAFMHLHTANIAKCGELFPYLAPLLLHAQTSSDSQAQSSHPGFSEHLIPRNRSPSSAVFFCGIGHKIQTTKKIYKGYISWFLQSTYLIPDYLDLKWRELIAGKNASFLFLNFILSFCLRAFSFPFARAFSHRAEIFC